MSGRGKVERRVVRWRDGEVGGRKGINGWRGGWMKRLISKWMDELNDRRLIHIFRVVCMDEDR